MMPLQILKEHFGYDSFRGHQAALIDHILASRDVVGIMPTGAGKSICFQVPAMALDGLTLVVSPLISLMKDQVQSLKQVGIDAAFINSSLTDGQISKVLGFAQMGVYKLLYVAPERLLSWEFIQFCRSVPIPMVTIDEAHCISQWGNDFRPSYMDIPRFIEQLPQRPIVSAFTATATPQVQADIVNTLRLREPQVMVAGFDRPNLFFQVQQPPSKRKALLSFLASRKNQTGVIYCATRNNVERVCDRLQQAGYPATRYHGGLSDVERRDNQDDFIHDRARVMVATNAFGMGIDKSNVSYVVHYNMPSNLEGYYQEAGRAGRDGSDAYCLLLYSGADTFTNRTLIEGSRESNPASDLQKLQQMEAYCQTHSCLRNYMLSYFGETPTEPCGNCYNCHTTYTTEDITIEAKKIISCVARMGQRFGTGMVVDVLKGSKNEKVKQFRLTGLSTYGISQKSETYLKTVISYLIAENYLHKTADKFPLLQLGSKAKAFLKSDAPLLMQVAEHRAPVLATGSSSPALIRGNVRATHVNPQLLEQLKQLRMKLASSQKIPAFMVFSDSSLVDMCLLLPTTDDEFLTVSGVGASKLKRYGKAFLEAIAGFHDMPQAEPTGGTAVTPTDAHKAEPQVFDPDRIEISPEPVGVSRIADSINSELLQCSRSKLSAIKINNWLVSQGYLHVVTTTDKSVKLPTDKGTQLGIITEERVIRGDTVIMSLFGEQAQQFIIANLEAIG